jgi:hypothetical protein
LQPAPSRGITRTDSPYERGHFGEQVTLIGVNIEIRDSRKLKSLL